MYVADLPSFDNISNYDMNVIWISNINNMLDSIDCKFIENL